MKGDMKTIFVRVPSTFSEEDFRQISELFSEVTPDEYKLAVMTDDIEFMSKDEVRQLGESLVEAVE